MSNTKSSSSSSSKKQLPRLSVLLSPYPKKDAKNFTEGTVISETPNEYDSFEASKELKLNKLQCEGHFVKSRNKICKKSQFFILFAYPITSNNPIKKILLKLLTTLRMRS